MFKYHSSKYELKKHPSHFPRGERMGNTAAKRRTKAERAMQQQKAATFMSKQQARAEHLAKEVQQKVTVHATNNKQVVQRNSVSDALVAAGAGRNGASIGEALTVVQTQLRREDAPFTKNDWLQLYFVLQHFLRGTQGALSVQDVFSTTASRHTVPQLRMLCRSMIFDPDMLLRLHQAQAGDAEMA